MEINIPLNWLQVSQEYSGGEECLTQSIAILSMRATACVYSGASPTTSFRCSGLTVDVWRKLELTYHRPHNSNMM